MKACTKADHEYATRAEFQAATINRRDWPETNLEIGECKSCLSTLGRAKPSCFEARPGLSDATAAELERIQGAALAGSAQ